MFKLIAVVSILVALCASKPSLVPVAAPIVTAASSQYYARNYNGLVSAPVVAPAPLIAPAVRFAVSTPVFPAPVLPASVLPAPILTAPGVISARYAAAPLLAGPAPYLARAAPYVAAPAPFLPAPATLFGGPSPYLARAPVIGPAPVLAIK